MAQESQHDQQTPSCLSMAHWFCRHQISLSVHEPGLLPPMQPLKVFWPYAVQSAYQKWGLHGFITETLQPANKVLFISDLIYYWSYRLLLSLWIKSLNKVIPNQWQADEKPNNKLYNRTRHFLYWGKAGPSPLWVMRGRAGWSWHLSFKSHHLSKTKELDTFIWFPLSRNQIIEPNDPSEP